MTNKKQKLELTWIGKDKELKLEPRILIEDPDKSYGDPKAENMLIHGDNLLALKALEQGRRKKKWRKRGRAKIPSPQPPSFLPARAKKFSALPREARQSKFAIRIFVKKSSDFVQQTPPVIN